YLNALRANLDCAVDVYSYLYEMDRGFYRERVQPKLDKGRQDPGKLFASPIDRPFFERLRKEATFLKCAEVRIADGKEAKCFTFRKAFTYVCRPSPKAKEAFDTAFYGLTVKAAVQVAPHRRELRLKLTQEVTDLARIEKQTLDGGGDEKLILETPKLVESSSS